MADRRYGDNLPWTEERLAELKRLLKGGFSAAEAARRLGRTTRSAVIAKAHREGIEIPKKRRPTKSQQKRRTKSRKETLKVKRVLNRVKPNPDLAPLKPEPFIPRPEPVTVPDHERRGVGGLEENQCNWPIGDPQKADFHFCNRKKLPGLPYCEHHRKVAYEPPRPRRRRTNRPYARPKKEVVNA